MSRRGTITKRCSSCGRHVPKRRCPGCGSVHHSWGYKIDVGAVGGKRKQRTKSGFKTKAEAIAALAEIQADTARGFVVDPSKIRLEEYLLGEWLPGRHASLRTSTYASYEANLRLHVMPRLGRARLQTLGPRDLDGLYAELLSEGRRDGSGGLSPRTVRYIHTILRKAFADAVRKGILSRNPADAAEPPAHRATRAKEMRTWSAEEVRAFLSHVKGDRLYAAWYMAVTTGMRRGELLGLRWSDVDFDAGRASIAQTLVSVEYEVRFSEPKTAKSRRSIAIDSATTETLRAHRRRQLEERIAWGPAWTDSGLVFTRKDGTPVHPDRFSKMFASRARAAGLPPIRAHDLRHTHATIMLEAGIHPKVVSERLGHASVQLTLDTYSHVIPALHERAAEQVSELLFGV